MMLPALSESGRTSFFASVSACLISQFSFVFVRFRVAQTISAFFPFQMDKLGLITLVSWKNSEGYFVDTILGSNKKIEEVDDGIKE